MIKLSGSIPALLTPLTADGKLNIASLEKIIELNLARGVTGFYVGGSTAEAFLYSYEQREEILKTVASLVKGRGALIAHIGFIDTAQSVKLGNCAQEAGYDCVSAVPPFYYQFTAEEIHGHYLEIVNQIPLPLIVYNIALARELSLDQIRQLLSDERIIGVKHTSSDLFQFERIKHLGKTLLSGPDEMFLASLSMGADGAIGSSLNIMADKFVAIQKLFKEGKNQEALAVQSSVNSVLEAALNTNAYFDSLKTILGWMGIECGPTPKPFLPLAPAHKKHLEKIYQTHLTS